MVGRGSIGTGLGASVTVLLGRSVLHVGKSGALSSSILWGFDGDPKGF